MQANRLPADFSPLIAQADHAAARFCRQQTDPLVEQADVRQDLLLDLLTRLDYFDPARSALPSFAAVCFRHRAARLGVTIRRNRQARSPINLDAPLPGDSEVTLFDILAESDGYPAWTGQATDAIAELDRRLDLDRALSALPRDALPICAALMRGDPDPAASAGLSRTTFYRRVQDLRCRLLVAGVGGPAGTNSRDAE